MKKLILITLIATLSGCATHHTIYKPTSYASEPFTQAKAECNYDIKKELATADIGTYIVMQPRLFKSCMESKGFQQIVVTY